MRASYSYFIAKGENFPLGSDPGDVEAAVDEGDFAGDGRGERGAEEDGGAADLFLLDVAVERGAVGDGVEDGGEVADAAGGEGVDGAGGDGVDADFLRAELGGEVADGGFEPALQTPMML